MHNYVLTMNYMNDNMHILTIQPDKGNNVTTVKVTRNFK